MAAKEVRLAAGLTLPLDVVTETIAVLAKRRVGKSYAMRKLAEQLHKARQQIVIVDPKGDQWGIRSSADGKGAGLPIIILGGERGDVPLEPSGGEVVAKLVVEERVSVLLDLSLFRKHEVATFMAAFLENLYRLKAHEEYRTAMMLIIDEADAIAPQKPQPGEQRMLGAAEDIVRRGGQRGVGCVLVTQRPAVLNKNVLTQAQVLIVLRTIAPNDLAAMNAWIDVHGTREERDTLMASLPSLPRGDAWVWAPGWPTDKGIFQRVHISPIETFDSGATPKAGETRIEPKRAAEVDLKVLQEKMAATIAKAASEDPKKLRAQIADLTKQLASKKNGANDEQVAGLRADNERERAARQEAERRAAQIATQRDRALTTVRKMAVAVRTSVENLLTFFDPEVGGKIITDPVTAPVPMIPTGGNHRAAARPPTPALARGEDEEGGSLPAGERKVLIAIAQHDGGVSREQLTVLVGYKATSRNQYIRRLQARGFVDTSGETVVATQEGINALGSDYEPLPTGDALMKYWIPRLPDGERRILEIVAVKYPYPVARDDIDAGYKATSRNQYIRRLAARKLVDVSPGGIRASATLFD